MSLLFTRIDVGTPDRSRLVARALEEVRTPPDEDWLGRVVARPGGWELLLSGPRRDTPEGWEWSPSGEDRAQYRCLLTGEMRAADAARRAVRALLWRRVVVYVADGHAPFGRQIEEAIWDVLTRSALPGAEAHAAPWPSAHGESRWAVTVERLDLGLHPELVYCGVVRSGSDLTRELSAALGVAAPVPASPLSFLLGEEMGQAETAAIFRGLVAVPAT